MSSDAGLVRRRVAGKSSNVQTSSSPYLDEHEHLPHERQSNPPHDNNNSNDEADSFDSEDTDPRNVKLNLMQEILLLGLKDKQGYTSFWNDQLSPGLRGAVLCELVLRKRIALEKSNRRKTSLYLRNMQLINSANTGDGLLDEALMHIAGAQFQESFYNWLHWFSGETWNPFNLRFQLKNVRERIAKGLVEKGVLSTDKKSFYVFDMTTHPLINCSVKVGLVKKIQEALLKNYIKDPHAMDRRVLALIILAYHSDVLENAFGSLSDDEYETAMTRTRSLLDLDFEAESSKPNVNETTAALWAVFAAMAK